MAGCNKKNSIGPILFLYYEESLVSSNLNSNQLRFDCAHPTVHACALLMMYHSVFQDKKYLIITAADSPKQDLTQYFPSCNDFIHAARLRGGHVLVHW